MRPMGPPSSTRSIRMLEGSYVSFVFSLPFLNLLLPSITKRLTHVGPDSWTASFLTDCQVFMSLLGFCCFMLLIGNASLSESSVSLRSVVLALRYLGAPMTLSVFAFWMVFFFKVLPEQLPPLEMLARAVLAKWQVLSAIERFSLIASVPYLLSPAILFAVGLPGAIAVLSVSVRAILRAARLR